jgi:ketosteroid isomerase-like protein
MKRVLPCGFLCLALLATAPWSHAQRNAAAEKAVARLEMQWLKAQRTNNADLVEPLLAEGFTNTSSDGKVSNKAETIAQTKATKYASVDYPNLKVMVFGDTAIAIGGFRATGTDASGKPLHDNERFTDTWTKMANGKWECVASHQSPVKM